jgi:hypothetical protein
MPIIPVLISTCGWELCRIDGIQVGSNDARKNTALYEAHYPQATGVPRDTKIYLLLYLMVSIANEL